MTDEDRIIEEWIAAGGPVHKDECDCKHCDLMNIISATWTKESNDD